MLFGPYDRSPWSDPVPRKKFGFIFHQKQLMLESKNVQEPIKIGAWGFPTCADLQLFALGPFYYISFTRDVVRNKT